MSIPAALPPRSAAVARPAQTQAAPTPPQADVNRAAPKATPAATLEVSAQARQAHATGVPPKHKKGLTAAKPGASAHPPASLTAPKSKDG